MNHSLFIFLIFTSFVVGSTISNIITLRSYISPSYNVVQLKETANEKIVDCERSLPRDQHCDLLITAKPSKD